MDRVTLRWEAAAGRTYKVQGSADGLQWEDLASWPVPDVTSRGGWLDVDGRAGLVVRGAASGLTVHQDEIILADGPAAPLLVEGLPGASPRTLRERSAAPMPRTDSESVRAALTDDHLSLFNLSDEPVTTRVEVPQTGTARLLFEGSQTLTDGGTAYEAELDAAEARLLPPRLTVRPLNGRRLPAGLRARVVDGATVELTGPACRVQVTAQGHSQVAVVRPGRTTTVTVKRVTAYPLRDLALGRTVFPTSPLPPGMSAPSAAVDGDPATAWTPGPNGRLVVDLGAPLRVREIRTQWTSGRVPGLRVEFSGDGLTYTPAGQLTGRGRDRHLSTDITARYVALATDAGHEGGANLIHLSLQ